MEPDEPIEHELLRNAVAAEITVTNTEVSPTSTGDGYIHIERAWATTGAPSRSRRRRALPPPPDSADQDTTEGLEPVAA